jgi:hypothetical protein
MKFFLVFSILAGTITGCSTKPVSMLKQPMPGMKYFLFQKRAKKLTGQVSRWQEGDESEE